MDFRTWFVGVLLATLICLGTLAVAGTLTVQCQNDGWSVCPLGEVCVAAWVMFAVELCLFSGLGFVARVFSRSDSVPAHVYAPITGGPAALRGGSPV